MASSALTPNLLETLPERPPTPPRESRDANRDAGVSLKTLLGRPSPVDPRLSLQTPPNGHSPASSGATNSHPSSSRLRKKVEWSSTTEFKEPVQHLAVDRPSKSKATPPSTTPCLPSRPLKGILKPSSSPIPLASSLTGELNGSTGQANIIEMLDSTIKQLAGSDRDSKLDAYMTLARALKASNNLPDRVALQDKMTLFTQFVQRDVTSKNKDGAPDTTLISQSLNLLATFLHFPAIASSVSTEFGIFIIDHAIRAFEDASVPKEVIRHLMQVVAFQSFSSKVMNSDRVRRLVASLHRIEDHMKGKSIVMSRIQIYKRLIKQSRLHMAVHCDWLKDLFTDMLSTIQEIQNQAISLGTEAGFALRAEKSVMRKAADIFETTNDDETYIEFYIKKLQDMFKEKQSLPTVPRIWSTIILFMRCPLEMWTYYGPWLRLVQAAFNTTDSQTKQEANFAWSRYVYLSLADDKVSSKVLPDDKTQSKTLITLCQPLLSQLRRKLNVKQPDEGLKLRRVVIGGVCNLYYYAFTLGSEKYSPDMIWDVAVQPIMAQLISLDENPETRGDSLMQASRMIVGLLDVFTPRVWKQDRIIDSPIVRPEELPSIDPKWIRRQCEKVFEVAGPILERKFTDLANKESQTYRLWQSLVGAVAAASAKDIKVSEDTTKFFACTFGILSNVWTKGLAGSEGSINVKFLPSVSNFVKILYDGLGILPFTEKRLSMTVANKFEPAATPSHRSNRHEKSRGVVCSPLHHLFAMLSSIPPGGMDDENFSNFFVEVFDRFFTGKNAKTSGEFTREILSLLPRGAVLPAAPWLLASRIISPSLDISSASAGYSPQNKDKFFGPEYREIVALLERGLLYHPGLSASQWLELFGNLFRHISHEFRFAGVALALTEPLARIILDVSFVPNSKPGSVVVAATVNLFEVSLLNCDRHALETARRRLWGAPSIARAANSDPFDNLYKLGNKALQYLYENCDELQAGDEVRLIVEAICRFISYHITQGSFRLLVMLQDGFSLWLRDERARPEARDQALISVAIRDVWNQFCIDLTRNSRLGKEELDELEILLTAAFKSRHRHIVNRTAEMWNDMFKDVECLECPESLLSTISSLPFKAELALPGIEQSSGSFGAQATSFLSSQEDVSFDAPSSASTRSRARQALPRAMPSSGTSTRSSSRKRRRDATTPQKSESKAGKRTSTPRLRHDNSQITFAPITSSPLRQEESQHLTERQKETRQKQRDAAAIYSDLRTSSPAPSNDVAGQTAEKLPSPKKQGLQDGTPERAKSYEDLISSTPTPRRGQVLHLDDLNDPPSSPPEPRPNPLSGEIQSRSRHSDSMEHWNLDFSSPPSGNHVTSHQQVDGEAELPRLVLTDDSTQQKTNEQLNGEAHDPVKVIPSSIEQDERKVSSKGRKKARRKTLEEPSTPPRQRTSDVSIKGHETPKSGEDEFVDARSSPQISSPTQAKAMAKVGSKSRLVVELEAKDGGLSTTWEGSPSPDKNPQEEVQECIMVHTDESSPPRPPPARRTRQSTKRSASPVIPSTQAELADVGSQEQGDDKKRKRSGPETGGGYGKRLRSSQGGSSQDVDDPRRRDMENSSPVRELRSSRRDRRSRTRQSSRKTGNNREGSNLSQPAASEAVEPEKQSRAQDGGDTDEELMSQLVTESSAASRDHSLSVAPDAADLPSTIEDSVVMGEKALSKGDAEPASVSGSHASNKPGEVMDMLRGGLKGLREAALSRNEVYKIEDMLMDIKRELFEAEKRGRDP